MMGANASRRLGMVCVVAESRGGESIRVWLGLFMTARCVV